MADGNPSCRHWLMGTSVWWLWELGGPDSAGPQGWRAVSWCGLPLASTLYTCIYLSVNIFKILFYFSFITSEHQYFLEPWGLLS